MANTNGVNRIGPFVPTTFNTDVSSLYSLEVTDPAFKELMVRLYQQLNNLALALNAKDTGYYDVNEYVCGQLYFPNNGTQFRPVTRLVVNFGALPNATTKSVAHGISVTPATLFTRIYGCATKPNSDVTMVKYIPLPYPSATAVADTIELSVDGTNVTVTTGADYSAYTSAYMVLEYVIT